MNRALFALTLTTALAASPTLASPNRPWKQQGSDDTIARRFAPLKGMRRIDVSAGGFGEFLRGLPLLPVGSRVKLFNGQDKPNQSVHEAVVDIDVGGRDLQQCADAVMRLYGEWAWSRQRANAMCFRAASGKNMCFGGGTYPTFRSWMNQVFTYANTGSLRAQMRKVEDPLHAMPGDVYIVGASGGMPFGHAVLVVDAADDARGQRHLLLAQSYMPAQSIHVLKNVDHPELGAWFGARADGGMRTPQWLFGPGSLYRFAGGS
ncbi:MAG: hypothetical protein FJ100_13430 [Deltaproteobacteria bacterium]|nr:hypothetical protein [Deltaproteobacteria bacterium]